MNRIKEKIWAQIFIIYTRYLIGSAFVFSSIVKIMGKRFTHDSGADNPIDSAWHFFETMYESGLYWKFIGIGQLIAGMLLMTQRYSKLGALVYMPIILNVFIITLSYYFAFTPVITGLMLLANSILILWEWNELKIIFNLNYSAPNTNRMEKDVLWSIVGLVLFVITIFFKLLLNEHNLPFLFLTILSISFIGLIVGLKREKKRRRLQHVNKEDI